jgi:hypothetical protein
MVVSGELAGLREVDEDVTGWAELRGHGVSLAESVRLAAEAAARRASEVYEGPWPGTGSRMDPGTTQGVG